MNRSLYLTLDLSAVVVPFIFSFHPKLNFYREWKFFFPATIITALIFIFWDVAFTSLGVWGFNPEFVNGIYFFNLPLEEILFFICVPYSCVFTYHALKILFPKFSVNEEVLRIFSILFSAILFLTGIIFHSKYYTCSSFLFGGVAVLYASFRFKQSLKYFFLTYIIILIPFFIMNGILTGSFFNQVVVWYNNNENLGVRELTIPLEDFIYNLALLLCNIGLFEFFRREK